MNPGFVSGPPLLPRADGASVDMMLRIMKGEMAIYPDFEFGLVDVRDVAHAHCLGMVTPEAEGRCAGCLCYHDNFDNDNT